MSTFHYLKKKTRCHPLDKSVRSGKYEGGGERLRESGKVKFLNAICMLHTNCPYTIYEEQYVVWLHGFSHRLWRLREGVEVVQENQVSPSTLASVRCPSHSLFLNERVYTSMFDIQTRTPLKNQMGIILKH